MMRQKMQVMVDDGSDVRDEACQLQLVSASSASEGEDPYDPCGRVYLLVLQLVCCRWRRRCCDQGVVTDSEADAD